MNRLFNGCAGGVAPDWSDFTALRLGGCIAHEDHTQGMVSHDRAEFFTVYGVEHDGCVMAITDTPTTATLSNARDLLAELARLSGLPAHDCAFLAMRGA